MPARDASVTTSGTTGGPPSAEARVQAAGSARAILDHVTSRWSVDVLCALSTGARRWGALRRCVDGVSEKMLASTLKTLEADGLVDREVLSLNPPRVEYSLTRDGHEVLHRLLPLLQWASSRDATAATQQ